MYTFIQLSLKEIISFKCTGYHYQSQEVDLAVRYCQLCNMCIWYSLRNVECYISDMFFDSSASINHVAFR